MNENETYGEPIEATWQAADRGHQLAAFHKI